MKSVLVISLMFLLASVVHLLLWNEYIYPKRFEADLKLADDASLPESKATYLTAYQDKISQITGTPRYIFMTPDKELDKQREILSGLIKRFNDIAAINSSEMAYQQGMQQLTGQEMNHQLDRISGLFKSAALRQNKLLFAWLCWGWLFIIPTLLAGLRLEIIYNL